MLCPFDFYTSFLRKMRFAFFVVPFLLTAPKLQAAQGTSGRLFVLSEGVGLGGVFVLEPPTAAKSRAETTVGVEPALI
jgi:hypothetical protein